MQAGLALSVYLSYGKGVAGSGSGHVTEVASDAFDTVYPTTVLLVGKKTKHKRKP